MKNWINTYHSTFDKYKINFTHWLGKKLINNKEYKWRLLNSLQIHFKHIEEEVLLKTSCPDNIDIELFAIAYVDSYSLEDFEKLGKGIGKIITKYGNILHHFDKYDKVREWLSECSSRTYGHGTYNVGWFNIKNNHQKAFNYLFESFQIFLNHFTPTTISLILIAKPSKKFKESFLNIINRDAKQKINIKKISLIHGIKSLAFTPEMLVRQIELDELFLMANKYIVKFFRKYFGIGMAQNGPLKNIEVLKLKQSLKIFPKTHQYDRKLLQPYINFFESIGKHFYHLPYFTDWYHLYELRRSQYYNLNNFQILVSEEDYKHKFKDKLREDISSEMFIHLTFVLQSIGTLLSIEFLLDNLNKSLLELRNKLTKNILKKRFSFSNINAIRKNTFQFLQLNETHFKYERIYNEIDQELLKSFFSDEINDLYRFKYKKEGKEHFTQDIITSIDRKTSFMEKQIKFLTSSFNNVVQITFTKSNYNLQIILVFLTILLLILTGILVLQEDIINTIKSIILRF